MDYSELHPICPMCGGVGEIFARITPLKVEHRLHLPGSAAAWVICNSCGFTGRAAVAALSAEAAMRTLGDPEAALGTLPGAISRAVDFFAAGEPANAPRKVEGSQREPRGNPETRGTRF